MALGNYNNSNKAEYKDPTVYSNYTFSNPESKVDATKLSFKYWKNSLAISISPRKNTNDSTISYDYQNQITIYLSHTKARILAEQIKALLSDEKLDSVGVNSGSSIITINRGTKYGTSNFVMEIVGLGEDGSATGSIAYEFKGNGYHYGICNIENNGGALGFDRIDYNTLELEQLITLLEEYYKAMTGAVAFSVVDQNKYGSDRTIDKIAEKLGVNQNNGNGNNYNRNSYFDNPNNARNTSSANTNIDQVGIDEIENELF